MLLIRDPDVVIGFDDALEKRMQRARKGTQPSNTQTLDEFVELLVEFSYKT